MNLIRTSVMGLLVATVIVVPSSVSQATSSHTECGTVTHQLTDGGTVSTPSNGCVLSVGDSGPAVRALQRSLRNCYGASIGTDGEFGSGTMSALIRAQSAAGVATDGVFGPITRRAMAWSAGSTSCSTLR